MKFKTGVYYKLNSSIYRIEESTKLNFKVFFEKIPSKRGRKPKKITEHFFWTSKNSFRKYIKSNKATVISKEEKKTLLKL